MQNIFPVDVVFTILGDEALNIQSVNKKNRTSIKVNGFDVYQQSLRYATFSVTVIIVKSSFLIILQ